jgi:hypothetical protein
MKISHFSVGYQLNDAHCTGARDLGAQETLPCFSYFTDITFQQKKMIKISHTHTEHLQQNGTTAA